MEDNTTVTYLNIMNNKGGDVLANAIGQMLKKHFSQSQFIVVSLKDGMFNNANVLFKTAFIDGVSTVKRFAQSRAAIEADDSSKENAKPRGKGRAARGAARPLHVIRTAGRSLALKPRRRGDSSYESGRVGGRSAFSIRSVLVYKCGSVEVVLQ